MNEIIDFVTQHWQLSTLLTVLVAGYVIFEIKQEPGNREVSAEQAIALYNHEQALILDVRSKEAYDQGHIVGALQLSADQIDQKIKKLQKYTQKPVVVVCNVGRTSLKVAKNLEAHGFIRALSLAGGISAWQAAGLPLTTVTSKSEL